MSRMHNEHSFVVPAYKDSPHLEECIASLLDQSVSTKIVITTSTPSDYIEGIAEKYQLPYCISDRPSSISSDWNFALAKSPTRYVTIAHQDDLYDRDYTIEVLRLIEIEQNKKPLIVFTNYIDLVNGQDRESSLNYRVKNLMLLPFHLKNSIRSKLVKKAVLSLGNPICCPSVTIDKVNTGEIRFLESFTTALDWQLWLKLASEEGAFLFVNRKLVKHRIHVDSETTNQILSGNRQNEEASILKSIWGNWMGSIISKVYTKGYSDNKI